MIGLFLDFSFESWITLRQWWP